MSKRSFPLFSETLTKNRHSVYKTDIISVSYSDSYDLKGWIPKFFLLQYAKGVLTLFIQYVAI